MPASKRRARPLGPQAHPHHYPHLRALGAVRAPIRSRAAVPQDDRAVAFAGLAIVLQMAWLAGVFLKIEVVADLSFWPMAVLPAVALGFANDGWSSLKASLLSSAAIPAAVLVFTAASLGIGAGIAWSRNDSLDWLKTHWQDILHGSLRTFFELWVQMLRTAGPLAALGLGVRFFADLVRK